MRKICVKYSVTTIIMLVTKSIKLLLFYFVNSVISHSWLYSVSLHSFWTGLLAYRQLLSIFTHNNIFVFDLECSVHSSIVVWKCHLTRFFHLKFTDFACFKIHHHNVCYMCIFFACVKMFQRNSHDLRNIYF